jgi:hypothetical protein
MAKRKLIIMNGRWGHKNESHIYVCAYSKADAARMLDGLDQGQTVSRWLREINVYFSMVWGNAMDKIIPERGAWTTDRDHPIPKKIL